MKYSYEMYLSNICYHCNRLTGKNYIYKQNKNMNNATIQWFENGYKKEFVFDVQLFHDYLKYNSHKVAEMVVLQ